MTILVRELIEVDSEAFLALRLQALESDPYAFTSTLAEETAAGSSLALARLRNPLTTTFGAFDGVDLIGTVTLMHTDKERPRHKATLAAMYVQGDRRGQGVADALMEAVVAKAAADPFLIKIMLEVVEGNARAKRFYERHGFAAFGTESHATRFGDDYLSEIMMVRFLGG